MLVHSQHVIALLEGVLKYQVPPKIPDVPTLLEQEDLIFQGF